jgi:signal-transduction protein with cAMP-binding, CBS, and nucleotidyltransferase domain
MEMRETHCVFSEENVKHLLETAGLQVTGFIEFQDIAADLEAHGLRLLSPSSWRRKFICIAETH